MTLAFRIICAAHCSGTHHKLAMDSLLLMKNDYSDRWRDLLLKHAAKYIEGSKAPDKEFRDFSNHVLHVEDEFWGGADDKAFVWYEKLVASLKAKDWSQAAYDAGVLSHYYTDPIQPLHTAQSEAENNIHRAFEWSISKSYEELRSLGEEEFSDVKVSHEDEYDWLERLVRKGAIKARAHYEVLVDSYDFKAGSKNPPEGLNEDSRKILAELIIYAATGFAGILDRAFQEAAVIPPHVNLTINQIFAGLKMPVRWVTNKLEDSAERKLVLNMYEEFEKTGKVEKYLPEDDRLVRDLYKEEVLDPKAPGSLADALKNLKSMAQQMREFDQSSAAKEKARRSVEKSGSVVPSKLRTTLSISEPVEKAPSIGKKTASRLNRAGINTVDDLLKANCEEVSDTLNLGYITPQKIKDWQDQARLVTEVPGLWGHDAQLLVAVDCRTVEALQKAKPEDLLARLTDYVETSKGKRILRNSNAPDITEVLDWIAAVEKTQKEEAA
ncbi:MAG: DUF4332 domain-containing protein [Methyloligellaceae bacterium]